MPVLGGLKAESGRVGRDFGPLLRAPTPGEIGGVLLIGELATVAMDERWPSGVASFQILCPLTLSHVVRTAFFDFWIFYFRRFGFVVQGNVYCNLPTSLFQSTLHMILS